MDDNDAASPASPDAPAIPPRPPSYDSRELLGDSREAWIFHDTQLYRLRLTANGKLYLTK